MLSNLISDEANKTRARCGEPFVESKRYFVESGNYGKTERFQFWIDFNQHGGLYWGTPAADLLADVLYVVEDVFKHSIDSMREHGLTAREASRRAGFADGVEAIKSLLENSFDNLQSQHDERRD
jgi:hypothetical protein